MFESLKSSLKHFKKEVKPTFTDSPPEPSDLPAKDTNEEISPEIISLTRKASSLAQGKVIFDQKSLSIPLQELELSLLSSDVEIGVAEAIIDAVRQDLVGTARKITTGVENAVEETLKKALLSVLDESTFDLESFLSSNPSPTIIIFVGVNGVGKTTTLAKFAHFLDSIGYSTVLANGDTYRAGANEQLNVHSEALGKKLITHQQGGDPTAVLYDAVEYAKAHDIDVVLCDTAGRLHTNKDLMSQLEKINRVVSPDLTIFIDEAIAGQDAVNRARYFNDIAPIDGVILTKIDADTSGGAAISITHAIKKPILFLGSGQKYEDLEPFDSLAFVDSLLD
jgi:fused signal recognition particle receptor